MNLFLEKLELHNFEGGTLTVEFGKKTNIKAANRGGKSRLKDAYHYLLTGRNAADQAQFDIKDTVNTENNQLPHRVIGHFLKDGQKLTLERTYLEINGSDKGEETKRLKGHTVEYKINGNVKVAKEFNEMLSMIIPTNLMKMVSDPLYFPNMKWDEQRKVLELMADDITDAAMVDKLATPENDLSAIINVLNAGDTLETRKTRIAYEIKTAKDKHAVIKPKIEENQISINNLPSIHITAVNAEISRINTEIEKIDEQINNKVAAEDAQSATEREDRNRINKLKSDNDEIYNNFVAAFNQESRSRVAGKSDLENEINYLKSDKQSKTALVNSLNAKNASIKNAGKSLMASFEFENKREMQPFDEDNFICQTCKRPHETDDIEVTKAEMINNFKEAKKKRLHELNTQGTALGTELAENTKMIETVTAQLTKVTADLEVKELEYNTLVEKINSQAEILTADQRAELDLIYISNNQEIEILTEKLKNKVPVDFGDLKVKKAELVSQLDEEKIKINSVQQKNDLQERNRVHAENEKTLAQQIATLEREQIQINNFIVARMDAIEEAVRSKFQFVTFKMFDQNIGDQTIKPFCEAWFEGKPYSALNTEAKLNAGLDIINALSRHYNTYAPILLDNREGVTDIIDVQSQVISFFVSPKHKTLTVEIEEN